MDKNNNFERQKLYLPEYGRHIHDMVSYLFTIEDRALRTRQAEVVVSIMGNVNPGLRGTTDYTHKLWDHLFIMSDFKLDVDAPYPMPSQDILNPKPQRMEYPRKHILFKHYGRNIQKMIRQIEHCNDHQAVDEAIGNIARYMRTKSYEYNQEHPNNEVIIKDIKRMSENDIQVDEVAINNLKSDYKQHQTPYVKRGKAPKHQQKNRKPQRRG